MRADIETELIDLRARVERLQHENQVFRYNIEAMQSEAQRYYAAVSQKDDLIKKLQDKIMLLDACRY